MSTATDAPAAPASRDRAVEWLRVYLARPGHQHAGDCRCGGGGVQLHRVVQARIALGVRLQRFLVSARGTCGVDTTASGPGSPRGRGSINQSGDVGGDLSAHPSRRSTGAVMIGGDSR